MDVSAAVRTFRLETMAALIRYYSQHPGASQPEAFNDPDLGLTYNAVWRGTTELVELGVLVETPGGEGSLANRVYRVDATRVELLLDALRRYVLSDGAAI